MPTQQIDDIQLYYELAGDGAPLLLIAGLASDSQSWAPIRDALSSRFRLILPDNRGVGRTGPQDAGSGIERIADDCVKLLRALDFSRVNVLGHSMGGFVAQDIAIRYPEVVDRLILAGTAPTNSSRNNLLFSDWVSYLKAGMDRALWFRNVFYWIFSGRFFEDEVALEEAVRLALEYPYPQSDTAFERQVQAIAEFDCAERLGEIRSQTLVIRGSDDALFPEEAGLELARMIPDATFASIDGAAHSIHWEHPRVFSRRAVDFLCDESRVELSGRKN